METIVAKLAFFGFALSFIVHFLTYFGVDLLTLIPVLWGLHIGIFVVFLPMIFMNRQQIQSFYFHLHF